MFAFVPFPRFLTIEQSIPFVALPFLHVPTELSCWKRTVALRAAQRPTVLQVETTECSAACLCMILAYRGHWAPLETLRVRCGNSV